MRDIKDKYQKARPIPRRRPSISEVMPEFMQKMDAQLARSAASWPAHQRLAVLADVTLFVFITDFGRQGQGESIGVKCPRLLASLKAGEHPASSSFAPRKVERDPERRRCTGGAQGRADQSDQRRPGCSTVREQTRSSCRCPLALVVAGGYRSFDALLIEVIASL